MPSVAEAPLSPFLGNGSGNGRKRRWEGESGEGDALNLLSPHQRRSINTEISSPLRQYSHAEFESVGVSQETQMKKAMASDRTKHDSKRQRIPSVCNNTTNPNIQTVPAHVNYEPREAMMDIDAENQDETVVFLGERTRDGLGDGMGKVVMDLSPCHICRRKPGAKQELEQFVDCERCGERSCGVCIRQCLGLGLVEASQFYEPEKKREERKGPVWHHSTNGMLEEDMPDHVPLRAAAERAEKERVERESRERERHRGMVCSHCCREKGVDGEVWCLGCLSMATRG